MRKIKKCPIFLACVTSLLTSCSNDSIAGTYGFQMGKENGVHFGIFITLTDTYKTVQEVSDKYKECTYTFSLDMGKDEANEGTFTSLMKMISTFLGQEEGKDISIPGYYYKGEVCDSDGTVEVKIGLDFSFLKNVFDELDLHNIDFPVLDPDTIEKIVYTTYLNSVLTLNIPVSEVDVIYQLYWYGVDFSYDTEHGIQIIDSPYDGKPGSHPTKEIIETINLTYGNDHKAFGELFGFDLSTYRDYYTLGMGLVKR